jgi:hypothetical protein
MRLSVICALVFPFAAFPALADSCGPRAAPIHMVNGQRADREMMQRGDEELIGYTRQVNRYLSCLSGEEKATRSQAKTVQEAYDRQVKAFNDRAMANAGT